MAHASLQPQAGLLHLSFQMDPNTFKKGFPAGHVQEDCGEPSALALQAPCIRSHGVLLLCSPSPPSFISPPNCE